MRVTIEIENLTKIKRYVTNIYEPLFIVRSENKVFYCVGEGYDIEFAINDFLASNIYNNDMKLYHQLQKEGFFYEEVISDLECLNN